MPGSFRCSYSNSPVSPASMRLRVCLARALSGAPDAEAAHGGSSTGSVSSEDSPRQQVQSVADAVVHGAQLCLRLWVPLWVVNATHLPVSAGVVALDASQAQQEQREQQAGARVPGAAPDALVGACACSLVALSYACSAACALQVLISPQHAPAVARTHRLAWTPRMRWWAAGCASWTPPAPQARRCPRARRST